MKARANRPLSPKQIQFVDKYVGGMNAADAARAVGYGGQYAKRAADRLIRNNANIRAAIDEAQRKIRESMAITKENRAKSVLADMELARQQKNMNAVMKGQELIAKMAGLLIDRVQVEQVSIREALNDARARVSQPAPPIIDVPADSTLALPALLATARRGNPFE